MPADHLNVIERALIDTLRNPSSSPWSSGDVTVFGQFPETEDIKYPCIIVEHVANGIETQFIGQRPLLVQAHLLLTRMGNYMV